MSPVPGPSSRGGGPVGLLLALVLLTTLLTGLGAATGPGPASAAPDPRKNHAKIPRQCALPRDLIPQRPVRCDIVPFRANRPTVVLWGDSHAWMMTPALKKLVKTRNVNLVAFFMGSCPPMKPSLRVGRYRTLKCLRSNVKAARFVRTLDRGSQPLKVVLGGSWNSYLTALDRQAKGFKRNGFAGPAAPYWRTMGPALFRWLGARGIDTDVIGQTAVIPRRASCRQRIPWGCDAPRRKSLPIEARTRGVLEGGRALLGGNARIIDVNPAFCDARSCRARVGRIDTWFDYLHISGTRARALTRYFAPTVDDVAKAR